MALQYGLKAIQQGSADNLPHVLGFNTPRTAAADTLFELWNGSTNAAKKFAVDLDGNIATVNGATFGAAPTPQTNGGAALGSAALRWSTIFGQALDLSAGATVKGALSVTGAATFLGGIIADRAGATGFLQLCVDGTSAYFVQAGAVNELRFLRGNGTTLDGLVSEGVLAWGTSVRGAAPAGAIVMKNGAGLYATDVSETDARPMLQLNSNNIIVIGDPGARNTYVNLGRAAPVAASAPEMDGVFGVDTNTNRLYYYSGGNRFYVTGTAF